MHRDNLVNRFLDACKNYPLVSVLLIIGIVVISLGKFTTSLDAIIEVSRKYWPSENADDTAKRKPKKPNVEMKSSENADDIAKRKTKKPNVEMKSSFLDSKWSFVRGRGYVKFLPEKIELSTHQAESMIWLNDTRVQDFDFTTEFLLVSGDTSLGFGPVFWLSDEKNYYHLAIRTNGDYRLIQVVDGEKKELIPWTHFPKIRGRGTKQTLRLVTKDGTIKLFIEGTMVDKFIARKGSAGSVGFRAADGGLSVDILKFDLTDLQNIRVKGNWELELGN